MAEAVSITEVFDEVAKSLHKAMKEKTDTSPEGVAEAVALEYGVPLPALIEAIAKQEVLGVVFMAMAGPTRALSVTQISAFIAGVAWEQGRRG